MFQEEDVATVRHVVQGILVPCVFVIGLLGNSVSIYVLTRRRMRCTTNIYLTALAITDIIYLTMALLLSLQHYDYMQRNCEFYWMLYGTFIWLCDACAYISIYIAVCFTIERFIAIRYPLKRQTFCTESLAKNVLAGVALFCLFSTISTAFEHQYSSEYKLIDITTGENCSFTLANGSRESGRGSNISSSNKTMSILHADQQQQSLEWQGSGNGPFELTTLANDQRQQQQQQQRYYENNLRPMVESRKRTIENAASLDIPDKAAATSAAVSTRLPQESTKYFLDAEFLISAPNVHALNMRRRRQAEEEAFSNSNQIDNDDEQLMTFNETTFCENILFYHTSTSSLGNNELYKSIIYYFTTIMFVLIPLCVLVTFNCFLIMLVRKSSSLRGDLTNASSMRRTANRHTHPHHTISQENRVTVTLIAVVLLFIVCQLPWAIYLITNEHVDINDNLQRIIGNIFNFLAAINAAANFFLYCVLSDKYRKTVRELLTGRKRSIARNTMTSASLYTNATLNGSRRYRPSST